MSNSSDTKSTFQKETKKEAVQSTESKGESMVETENESISMEEAMIIKQQNDELNTKVADFESMLKRQQAEFENYRKRTIREREDFQKYAIIPVVKDLLSVADNFERALKVEVNVHNKDFIEGFEMINKQLFDLFIKHDVMEVDGAGHVFDPSSHQAIQSEEKEDHAIETVAEVYQKGYKLYDRVIRTATVKVYKAASLENLESSEREEQGKTPENGNKHSQTDKEVNSKTESSAKQKEQKNIKE